MNCTKLNEFCIYRNVDISQPIIVRGILAVFGSLIILMIYYSWILIYDKAYSSLFQQLWLLQTYWMKLLVCMGWIFFYWMDIIMYTAVYLFLWNYWVSCFPHLIYIIKNLGIQFPHNQCGARSMYVPDAVLWYLTLRLLFSSVQDEWVYTCMAVLLVLLDH